MTLEKRNLHLKLQEYCDCFMETDLKNELKGLSGELGVSASAQDLEEYALKFIGLAVLYGVNESAKSVVLSKTRSGDVQFTVSAAGDYKLPAPSSVLADRVFDALRNITHLEGQSAYEPLSLGLRGDRIELGIHFDEKGEKNLVRITFPEI